MDAGNSRVVNRLNDRRARLLSALWTPFELAYNIYRRNPSGDRIAPTMDVHSSHLNPQTHSRGSSQTPSPSHSAASASSLHHNSHPTRPHHLKRKLPDDHHHRHHHQQPPPFPPSSDTTTNDSISARPNSSDSDTDEDDEFHDNGTPAPAPSAALASSIRTFTAARLESSGNNNGGNNNGGSNGVVVGAPGGRVNGSSNNSNSCGGGGGSNSVVKLEKEELAKGDGAGSAGGSGKEDAVKIFTENIQTSGAYSAREESLKREVGRCLLHGFRLRRYASQYLAV